MRQIRNQGCARVTQVEKSTVASSLVFDDTSDEAPVEPEIVHAWEGQVEDGLGAAEKQPWV